MFFHTDDATHTPLSGRQRLALIALDVALLAEVTLSVYLASRTPDAFTQTFMKAFFVMALPSLVAGVLTIRYLGRRTEA